MVVLVLAEEVLERGVQGDGAVDDGVGPGAIGADLDQLFHVGIGRQALTGAAVQFALGRGLAAGQGPADRLQHVDGGEAAALGDLAVHDDVAVQNTAYGVGDRLVMVAAVHQDGEQGGDRPGLGAVGADRAGTGALQQLGQFGEDGGGIALGRRRLARGQADLALGHGEAGDRVHQAQDFQTLITQVFRDGQGHIG
ncbi:hypothetical protein D3C72_1285540 [compost metagenome]